LTAIAATVILAAKELFTRRSLRPNGHPHPSELKLTEMSAAPTRRAHDPRSSPILG
jgi:hypothetical protein